MIAKTATANLYNGLAMSDRGVCLGRLVGDE
jgi:hypothetical protein